MTIDNYRIDSLISVELKNIDKVSGSFNSPHEGWAVIREEYYETRDELEQIEEYLNELDNCVRHDKKLKDHMKNAIRIKERAIRVIEEAIQIAATAIRYYDACDGKLNDFNKLK